jgi:phosphate transport system substrate-binding protein
VATEDYPPRRLFLYVPADANAFARKFADFAISDMAQGIADQIGFVGQVPEESRSSSPSFPMGASSRFPTGS